MTIKAAAVSAIMIFAAGGCSTSHAPRSENILEQNYADISVQEPKVCKRVELFRDADGSLWIGDPSKQPLGDLGIPIT